MIILFIIIKMKIIVLVKWSYRFPLIVLTIEFLKFRARCRVSLMSMSFWYPLLELRLTNFDHLDMGAQLLTISN